MKRVLLVLLCVFLLSALFLTGCANSAPATPSPTAEPTAAPTAEPTAAPTATPTPVKLLISVAASLKKPMEEIATLYATEQPAVTLEFNFGASGTLQTQIEQGAPADIFISAAQKQMDALEKGTLLLDGTRVNLLQNKVVLVVPKGNTAPASFEELATDTVKQVGLGDPASVPAGQYAQDILTFLKIADKVNAKAVLGKDVTEVLSWVESGNVDAGVVYASDAFSSDKVTVTATASEDSHKPVVYPAAVIKASANADAAKALIAYLQTEAAKAVFEKYGFTAL